MLNLVVRVAIIVSVVFWTILAGSNEFSSPYLGEVYPGLFFCYVLIVFMIAAWSNITQHLFNTLFALLEILCTNCGPSPWSHLPFLVLILGAYLGLAYITHAVDGFYRTFSPLDMYIRNLMRIGACQHIPSWTQRTELGCWRCI